MANKSVCSPEEQSNASGSEQKYREDGSYIKIITNKILSLHERFMEKAPSRFRMLPEDIERLNYYEISAPVVVEIASRIHKDINRLKYFHDMDDPDQFKRGSLHTYWISKLNPIYFQFSHSDMPKLKPYNYRLNQYFAIYAGFTVASEQKNLQEINPSLMTEFVYTLRNRKYSSDTINIVFRSLVKNISAETNIPSRIIQNY